MMTNSTESWALVVNEPSIIIIHCSASDNPDQDSVAAVRYLHTSPKTKKIKWGNYSTTGKGWRDVGYHYYIPKDGTTEMGRLETQVGAHVRGHNRGSIGICLGGVKDFTRPQFKALDRLLIDIHTRIGIDSRDVYGHYEFDDMKTCPNINMDDLRYRFMQMIASF